MKLWLNGALVERDPAPDDPSGDGLVETIAIRDGMPRRLPAHFMRMRIGCQLLGIPFNVSEAQFQAAVVATVAANNLTRGVARVIVARGPDVASLITVGNAPEQGSMKLIVAASMRRNEQSPLSMIPTLNGIDHRSAIREAAAAGADDAVLLNTQGRVAETTNANIFVLEGGGLLTPPMEEGAMAGIMRAEVIRLTRAEETPVTLERLMRASEVFVTSTLGVRPVIAINGAPVGDGEPGLITQMLAVRL